MTTMQMTWDGIKLQFGVGFASMEELTTFLDQIMSVPLKKFGYRIEIVKDTTPEKDERIVRI